MRDRANVPSKSKKYVNEAKSMERQCYALLALPLIGFFVFTIYPMIWAASKSFFFDELVPGGARFVGLENFFKAFHDKLYWKAWITTLQFTFIKLPFEIFITLILASILNRARKFAGFFRTMYFMPTVISAVVIAVTFANLFDYFGFVNHWLMKLGIITENINWFGTKAGAMTVLIIGNFWGCFGTNVVYFSAALSNVPKELYEAAELDGASGIRQFTNITVPMIAPVFQTILLLGINGSLHTGDYIIAMTNGAPGGLTHTAASYIITTFIPGYAQGTVNVGYGCAVSLVSSFIYVMVALVYTRLTRKMQDVY